MEGLNDEKDYFRLFPILLYSTTPTLPASKCDRMNGNGESSNKERYLSTIVFKQPIVPR
jgi:hypothetical protein